MYIFFYIFIAMEFISLLSLIRSHQLFLDKYFIIIESVFNYVVKAL